MKKIGFIDYFLSEWHANNYPAWIHELSKKFKEEFQVAYAWAEVDISPFDGVSTDQWCEKYRVERCNSIQELCEKSDYILVLSPSNPEMHLKYAKEVSGTTFECRGIIKEAGFKWSSYKKVYYNDKMSLKEKEKYFEP